MDCYLCYNYIAICLFTLRLRNDLYCVEWGVKLYSLTRLFTQSLAQNLESNVSL